MTEFQYLDGGNSEVQDMQAEAFLYASSGTVGIAATGVIDGLIVTQTSTASGSVLIGAGACINQASLGQGASRLINPSQKTLDIFTANPVGGLPRNDIVAFDSVTKLIMVIVGTPNATPTDPTVPATSVALARLRHAASATTILSAKIDQLQVPTTLRGAASDSQIGFTSTKTTMASTPLSNTAYAPWTIASYSITPTRDGWATVACEIDAQLVTAGYAEVFIDLRVNWVSIDGLDKAFMFESPVREAHTISCTAKVFLSRGVASEFEVYVKSFSGAGTWKINTAQWRIVQQ